MQKIKVLVIDEKVESRLFELLAESLASKDFGLANDACAIRNTIANLPVHQVPLDFDVTKFLPGGSSQVPMDGVKSKGEEK